LQHDTLLELLVNHVDPFEAQIGVTLVGLQRLDVVQLVFISLDVDDCPQVFTRATPLLTILTKFDYIVSGLRNVCSGSFDCLVYVF